ncbi:hypothetical protein CK203_016053 [Vitis vinifera]|uniref:GAG-pre-integrase domain-containing protein n=1 Tax=Vitis vinifera TaxID=29760 RepID=A0A438JN79_VITVI|nr:hypothetical protein CK203_016053 [Vitis vinifera]
MLVFSIAKGFGMPSVKLIPRLESQHKQVRVQILGKELFHPSERLCLCDWARKSSSCDARRLYCWKFQVNGIPKYKEENQKIKIRFEITRMIGHGERKGGLYYLNTHWKISDSIPQAFITTNNPSKVDQIWLWHKWLGHPPFFILEKMFPTLFGKAKSHDFHCEGEIGGIEDKLSGIFPRNAPELPDSAAPEFSDSTPTVPVVPNVPALESSNESASAHKKFQQTPNEKLIVENLPLKFQPMNLRFSSKKGNTCCQQTPPN